MKRQAPIIVDQSMNNISFSLKHSQELSRVADIGSFHVNSLAWHLPEAQGLPDWKLAGNRIDPFDTSLRLISYNNQLIVESRISKLQRYAAKDYLHDHQNATSLKMVWTVISLGPQHFDGTFIINLIFAELSISAQYCFSRFGWSDGFK